MNRSRIPIIALIIIFLMTPATFASSYDKHEIKFNRINNARDLGGYKTKDGRVVKKKVIIRSAELSYATKKDLKKLKNEYHLARVYDFRYGADRKKCANRKISGVKYVGLPVAKGKGSKSSCKKRYRYLSKKGNKALRRAAAARAGKASRNYTYRLVMSKYSQKQYRKYFNYLLSNKNAKGVLFHCVHGKDRTGVAAFMTLVALGVPEKTAYADYAMTNKWVKKYNKKAYKRGGKGVRTSDLKYAVRKAKKKYGSMNRFLYKAYGLDSKDLKKLRNIYTE